MNKLEELHKEISLLVEEGACIAFSGGMDSSLILKIACEEGIKKNKKIHAVTFDTKLHPVSDISISKRVALEMRAMHTIISINEFENEEILKNPIHRCYECKKMLFLNLKDFANKKILNIY